MLPLRRAVSGPFFFSDLRKREVDAAAEQSGTNNER
jgi:hypothetical protein